MLQKVGNYGARPRYFLKPITGLMSVRTRAVRVWPSTESASSSYGILCWIDAKGNTYGQCVFGGALPRAPLGFRLIWEDA